MVYCPNLIETFRQYPSNHTAKVNSCTGARLADTQALLNEVGKVRGIQILAQLKFVHSRLTVSPPPMLQLMQHALPKAVGIMTHWGSSMVALPPMWSAFVQ